MMKQVYTLLALLLVLFSFNGCQVFDAADNVLRGDGDSFENTARYTGLNGKKIGILVNADQDMLYSYPRCDLNLAKVLAGYIKDGFTVRDDFDGKDTDEMQGGVKNSTVIPPNRVYRYKMSNIYWQTETPAKLAKDLKVDRLIWVELNEFTTHSPGNKILKQGRIIARISVYESDGPKPNSAAYEETVSTIWPPDDEVGEIKKSHAEVLTVVQNLFGRKAAGLFFDHTSWKKHDH